MEVAGQGDQAESGGELACTSASQFAPATDFVWLGYFPNLCWGPKWICCTLSPTTTGVGISGRGCAAWFGKMVEATYLVKQALWSFQRNLKSFVLSNTERLPMSM